MKKIFIIVLLSLFVLTGCGAKTEVENNNQPQEQPKENTEKQEANDIIFDDEIIDIEDVDNAPITNDRVVVEKVINCDGCVFSYFDKEKPFGATLSSEEYTTDINNIRTKGNKQRHNFFGFVLNGNTISRAYSCILKDNKIYCIEGTTNGSKYESNIAVLNQIFTSGQCRYLSEGHTYTCTDGHYNGDTKSDGYTSLLYETSCVVFGQKTDKTKLNCY